MEPSNSGALVSKVTKASLEEIAAKEAARQWSLIKKLVLVFPAIVIIGIMLPPVAWWGVAAVCVAHGVFVQTQMKKLETLEGRAAGKRQSSGAAAKH